MKILKFMPRLDTYYVFCFDRAYCTISRLFVNTNSVTLNPVSSVVDKTLTRYNIVPADGSPRLGKLRKCYKSRTPENLEVPFTSSESGFDTEPESLSNSTCDNEEINR